MSSKYNSKNHPKRTNVEPLAPAPLARWIMAIDPSLTGFAMAFWRTGAEVELVEHKSPTFGKNPAVSDRLARYHGLIDYAVAEARARNPLMILIEGYAYNARGSVVYLGEFGGLLRDRLQDLADNVYEVQPSALKRFATGNGAAKKAAVVSALASKYGMAFKTDNEADAYGLLQIGILAGEYRKPENETERKILFAVRARGETIAIRGERKQKKYRKRDVELYGEVLEDEEEAV